MLFNNFVVLATTTLAVQARLLWEPPIPTPSKSGSTNAPSLESTATFSEELSPTTKQSPSGSVKASTEVAITTATSSGAQSSVTSAFAEPKQSLTSLVIDGITLQYTKEVIGSLASITTITTISSQVPTTNEDGSETVVPVPIIVGPQGIWWRNEDPKDDKQKNEGPGGSGSNGRPCIWPFCPPGGGGGPPIPPPPSPPPNPNPSNTPNQDNNDNNNDESDPESDPDGDDDNNPPPPPPNPNPSNTPNQDNNDNNNDESDPESDPDDDDDNNNNNNSSQSTVDTSSTVDSGSTITLSATTPESSISTSDLTSSTSSSSKTFKTKTTKKCKATITAKKPKTSSTQTTQPTPSPSADYKEGQVNCVDGEESFSLKDAKNNVEDFCDSLVSGEGLQEENVHKITRYDDMLMQLHSIGDGQFCPEFKGMDPEDVLLHRWRGKDWCVHNFMSIVNHCAPHEAKNEESLMKKGGEVKRDCGIWAVIGIL